MEAATDLEFLPIVKRYWGFDSLRPLQEEAIRADVEGRDSLVVLPTGGGKSLCYQVPPLVRDEPAVVVSPLISLMKDQLDGLLACGYPAVTIHSGMGDVAKRRALDFLRTGACRLVLVSPERLLQGTFLELIDRLGVRSFSIDEAHCISHWGHDFRPEYRRLARLRQRFAGCALHAYTATATPRVREDIRRQLELEDPLELIGRFDRPNLLYRVVPRESAKRQLLEVVDRHRDEAVIAYAMTRAETERLASFLQMQGVRAEAYHAGLPKEERQHTQERFSRAEIQVVVATVAFGMGIDRSDVRCVMHTAMPKSIEHYQQETGRAGRDGLEAECVLLFSPADILRWEGLIEKSAREAEAPEPVIEASRHLLAEMRRYCSPGRCRHARLSEYFGQSLESDDCGACDVCLGECPDLVDGTETAQKILSCVARVGQRFGIGHVVGVLRGLENQQILAQRHEQLSTFGLLKDHPQKEVTNQVYQLVDQGLLSRTEGDYPVLKLNPLSVEVLRGQRAVQLMPAVTRKKVKKTAVEAQSWEGVDRDLFERLRKLRTELAAERGVPPYVVFGDRTLRELARLRPSGRMELLEVHGIGEKKLADYGDVFLEELAKYAAADPVTPPPSGTPDADAPPASR